MENQGYNIGPSLRLSAVAAEVHARAVGSLDIVSPGFNPGKSEGTKLNHSNKNALFALLYFMSLPYRILSLAFFFSSLLGFGQSADSLTSNYRPWIEINKDSATVRLGGHVLSGKVSAGRILLDSMRNLGGKEKFRLTLIDLYLLETLLGRHDLALAGFRTYKTPKARYETGLHMHHPQYHKIVQAGLSDTSFRTSTALSLEDKAFSEYQRQNIYERYIWLFDNKIPSYAWELYRWGSNYRAVNALLFQKKYPSSRYGEYIANEIHSYENISRFRLGGEMQFGPAVLSGVGGKASIGFSGQLVVSVFTESWSLGGGGSGKGFKSPKKFYYGHDSVAKGARLGLFGGMMRGEYRFKTLPGRSLALVGSYRFGDGRLAIGKSRKDDTDSNLSIKGSYDISLGLKRGWSFDWGGEKGRARWDFGVFLMGEVGYFHPVPQVHGFYANFSAGFGWYFGRITSKISKVMCRRLRWKPVPETLELVEQKPPRRPRAIF